MFNFFFKINYDTGVMLTFKDLRLKTIRVAQNLQRKGFQHKDVFSFLAPNSDNLCPVVFASFSLGCPISPLHSELSKEEIVEHFMITKPKAIFCDVDSYTVVDGALKESNLNASIFTFNGQTASSEPIESLLIETGNEKKFV